MASKRKHSSCTVEQKLKALKRLDNGESLTKIAAEIGVGKATVSDWKKNRLKIEQFSTTTSEKTLKDRHHVTVSVNEKIDEAVFLWFSQERQKGVPISGPLIQEKALQLNRLMNGELCFSASNGWLDRWKKRHGVRQLSICGEKLSADTASAEEYIKEFAEIVSSQNYSPQQIYNADETGLNFKALPTKSLASQEESSAPGHKMNKQRLTVLACSNVTGTNKLPLMVIGKAAKPRALKNLNMNSLPVFYRNQSNSWMSGPLFKEWFDKKFVPSVKKFNEENELPQRALLLIDNATCHPSDMQLVCGDIKAIILPPNVTSLFQPMDQGILNHVKLSYRKKLLRFLIENDSDSIGENLKKITIKDVIYWLAESWQNTNESFLRKSWKKLWPELEFEEAPDPTPVTQQELLNLVQQVPGCENAGEGYLEEWATVDVTEEYSDRDIVGMVQEQRDGDVGGSDSEGDEAPTDVVTYTEAASALDIALRFVEQHPSATPNDVMFMRRWLGIASAGRFSSLRQLKITDFK